MRHFVLLLVLVAGSAGSLMAQVINVPAQVATIQGAINAASNGGSVLVAPGVYNEDIDFQGKGILVQSVGDSSQTIIQGTGTGPVVTMTNGTMNTVLDGFTVSGGTTGILIEGFSSPVVRNCIMTGNHSVGLEGGGGVRIMAELGVTSSLLLINTKIHGNTSENAGGGIQVETRDAISSCTLTLLGCEVYNNVALGNNGGSGGCVVGGPACATRGGGGIHVFSRSASGVASMLLKDSTVSNNIAVHEGGGILLENADTVTIDSCRIANNIAALDDGGGIAALESGFTMNGSFVTRNETGTLGGGIMLDSNLAHLVQIETSTIADNLAALGGGILVAAPLLNLNVASSIVWGNQPLDYYRASGPSFFQHCNVGPSASVPGTMNSSVDPRFCSPTTGDYHLTRGSPCVDAGDPFAIGQGLMDLDMTPRIVGGQIDMGADEVPAHNLLGSNEDLEFHAWRLSGSDPNEPSVSLSPGDVLLLRLKSPQGTFLGAPALIVGQPYTTGSPPQSPASLPGIHVDGFGLQVVYGDPSGAFLSGPTIPGDGVYLGYLVPAGFAGFSFRLQGFAVTAFATNGAYAVTEAKDLVF